METILKRIINKVNTASIDPKPSDNIYMEDIFDTATYSEILTRLPADENYNFIEHPDAVLPDGTVTRKLLDLTDETIKKFHSNDQAFWHQMKEALTSDILQKIIMQKFYGKIKARYGDDWPQVVTVPVFYRDFPGYRITPHTDAPFKIATMQFYFPKDDSQIHLGTSFLERKGNQFELLKTNQFKPNSAYAFARTDESWHCVQEIPAHESPRNTLALTLFVKGYEYKSTKEYM